ncbi:MAG: AraC family transcriptional regulator [Myxococcota bacterium]|nr:AraC family transcriptional regulator [Myxococcota bacterium]
MGISISLARQYVHLIAEQIQSHSGSLEDWLSESGITLEQFQSPGLSTNFNVFRQLTLNAVQMTKEPALGLVIGEQLGVTAHGALGYAAVSCSTIREVIALIEQYLQVRIGLLTMSTFTSENTVDLHLEELFPLGDIQPTIMEAVLCSIKNVLEDVSLGACTFQSIHFSYPEPSYAALAREIFGKDVIYNSSFCGLRLERHMLGLGLKMADPRGLKVAEDLCQRELNQLKSLNNTTARVRRLLIERRHHLPTLPTVARILHLTPRTLHRRLKSEGTAFRELLDEFRYALARDYLLSRQTNIDEIAYRLGYSDSANFRRAFRRWSGVTPSAFRNQVRL